MSKYIYVGRYSIHRVRMVTRDADALPVEPDINPTVSLRTFENGEVVASRMAEPTNNPDRPWEYEFVLSSVETATPGLYYLLWEWHLDGVPQLWRDDISVSDTPLTSFSNLPAPAQGIVDQVWIRLADLFDSALGGPHLQEYAQTNFGKERIAQLMPFALQRITSRVQQRLGFHLDDDNGYPYAEWSGLLGQSLWIETLKHLSRSYIEQPTPQGVPVARLDRKDYSRAWADQIAIEEREYGEMLDVFKLSNLGLGTNVSVIVSGGVYGKASPPVPSPARGRYPVLPPRWW